MNPTRCHLRLSLIFHMLLEKIILVSTESSICNTCTMCFPTLLYRVPSAAAIHGIQHINLDSLVEYNFLLRITDDHDKMPCPKKTLVSNMLVNTNLKTQKRNENRFWFGSQILRSIICFPMEVQQEKVIKWLFVLLVSQVQLQ